MAEVRTRPLFVLTLKTNAILPEGCPARGDCLIGIVAEGTFDRDRLRGAVLPGGNDWRGEHVDRSEYQVRMSSMFETSASKYHWSIRSLGSHWASLSRVASATRPSNCYSAGKLSLVISQYWLSEEESGPGPSLTLRYLDEDGEVRTRRGCWRLIPN